MRYRISHITEYAYSARVSHCYNMAHLIPRTTNRQTCITNNINVQPYTAFHSQRQDYFGNTAYHFEIQRPHKKLVIDSTSEIETLAQNTSLDLDIGLTCAQAKNHLSFSKEQKDIDAREFILNSPMIKSSEALRKFAEPFFPDDRPFLSAVMEFTSHIFNDFTYDPQSTTVSTPIEDVLKNKRGVCQDFAHLQIGCLRSLGFPAKYVSGYIETLPPPGQEKLVGSDASHAWVSVYSPYEGWFEFDPTNNCLVNEQYIITAWGRDYFDITPLKGVIYGGGDSPLMTVSVDVRRLPTQS